MELNEKLKIVFNQDHFNRLRESIAICLNKAFQDVESNNNNVFETIKKQNTPMDLLEHIEKNMFDYCGIAEQQLASLKMQVMKDNFDINHYQE
jgi:hypothetical protein